MESWELIKGVMSWVVYPVICLLAWMFKAQYDEIKIMKEDVAKLKTDVAVTASQVQDIREDIKDLISVVRNAEKNITEALSLLLNQYIVIGL